MINLFNWKVQKWNVGYFMHLTLGFASVVEEVLGNQALSLDMKSFSRYIHFRKLPSLGSYPNPVGISVQTDCVPVVCMCV